MKKGFTIIEVALVLAIGGLIFLMVFVALPGLRASQRNTSRREDMISLVESIQKFQTNNRGGIPSTDGGGSNITYDSNQNIKKSTWKGFYRDYFGSNFHDPNGEDYKLTIVDCGSSNVDQVCANGNIREAFFPNNYTVSIVLQAACKGEQAIQTANPRNVAVLYKLEGAGTYCGDL